MKATVGDLPARIRREVRRVLPSTPWFSAPVVPIDGCSRVGLCAGGNAGCMYVPPDLPAPLGHRSFTVPEAKSLGVSRSRTRAKGLVTPSRSIRVPRGIEQDLPATIRPYLVLAPHAAACSVTAARLHGMPLPRSLQNEPILHFIRSQGNVRIRRRGVYGHAGLVSDDELTVVAGVRATTLMRTWFDLGSLLKTDDLVVAGDFAVSRPWSKEGRLQPRTTVKELSAYLESKAGQRGVARCRTALDLVRPGVDSPPETRIRLLLQRAGLPEFRPNALLEGGPGEPPIWADLGCETYKVCIEYEGEHHLTPQKQGSDRFRDVTTAARGWLQVKIYAADVRKGPDWIILLVRQALMRRGYDAARG